MAQAIYMTANGVLSHVPAVYMTANGVLKKIQEGYITVSGVERPFFNGFRWNCVTRVHENTSASAFNGTYTVNSYSAGLEDSGKYVMRVNATFSASTDRIRVQAYCMLYGSYKAGDSIQLKWSSGTDPSYTDKIVNYLNSSGNSISGKSVTLSSGSTSGTYSGTIPEGTDRIMFLLSVGTKGTTDTYFSLNSLTIGGKTYI